MSKIYGYARISRKEQSIERQIRNIKAEYPEAIILQEAFTGTKIQGRTKLEKILKAVKAGDTIVFDSVSRMSRNAEDGSQLYFELFEKGVNLCFLKERHIDTESYKTALAAAGIKVNFSENKSAESELIGNLTRDISIFLKRKASDDIRLAFEQAQKEVDDLHQRTREGVETARLEGKQIGQIAGAKLNIKKKEPAKAYIRKNYKAFGGKYNGIETAKNAGISWNTFKKYLAEIEAENK